MYHSSHLDAKRMKTDKNIPVNELQSRFLNLVYARKYDLFMKNAI